MSRASAFLTDRTKQASAWLLLAVLMLSSTRLVVSMYWHGDRWENILYQAATVGFNYFEFGPIRRGLGGSIVYALSRDAILGTVLFHLLSAAAVSVAAAVLFRRMAGPFKIRLAVAMMVVFMMLCWAEDAGRTDMSICALLGFATLAVVNRRLLVAAGLLCIGLFIHESSFIFGAPLMVALLIRDGALKSFAGRTRVAAVGLVLLTLATYIGINQIPHADQQFMVDTVRAKFPSSQYVDWAIYFALSGRRGVEASMCQNQTDPSYWVHPFGGLVVIVVAYVALARHPRRDLLPCMVAALPPFAFLCFVANDISRWTLFASFNMWLVTVTAAPAPAAARSQVRQWLSVTAALCFVMLVHPKMNKIPLPLHRPNPRVITIYAGSPLIERIVRLLGGPATPTVDEALRICDPAWRRVLGDQEYESP